MDAIKSDKCPFETFKMSDLKRHSDELEIHFSFPFTAYCPVYDPPKEYSGWIDVNYTPRKYLVNWDSFSDYVCKTAKEKPLTVENLSEFCFALLKKYVEPITLRVLTRVISPDHLPVEVYSTMSDKSYFDWRS